MADAKRLADSFIHLGLGATAVPHSPFDGMGWYDTYSAHHVKVSARRARGFGVKFVST